VRVGEVSSVDVLDVAERVVDGLRAGRRRVVGAERLVTEDLDAAVVEVEPDFVGDLPEVLPVDELDRVWVVVLLEAVGVLAGGVRESTGRDDHAAFRAGGVESGDCGVEFLDDRAADGRGVLAFDDDRPSGAVDDLFHEDVPAFVGRALGLADVLVAEIPEHVLHEVLELEPREIV
jgi:hypothetical protein